MNWTRITNKALIEQIKQGATKIRIQVVRRSISNWTNRVYRMLQHEGEYVFRNKDNVL